MSAAQTHSPAELEQCLHEIFERQAQETPDLIALTDGERSITYREAREQAKLIANLLKANGVCRDEVVAIFMDRCVDYVIACLGALMAGGAFLPLELAYPPFLVENVLADSNPKYIISKAQFSARLPATDIPILDMDQGWEASAILPREVSLPAGKEPHADSLCFVVYSSGTTNQPKGIENPHRARSYLLYRVLTALDRVACNVFFVWECFRPLLRGATTIVVPDHVIFDAPALIDFLEATEATEILMTPSLCETVLNTVTAEEIRTRLTKMKTVYLNGEVVTTKLRSRLIEALPQVRPINLYSISECHEVCCSDLLGTGANSAKFCPVGRPMPFCKTLLFDEDMNEVPNGEAGELYVAGPCLARGYLGRPDMTAERFPVVNSQQLYRTGDVARFLPDGNLEVLGRCAFMVKIRGYSVVCSAVETAIIEVVALASCIVVTDGEEGEDKRLVAYLIRDTDKDGETRLKNYEITENGGCSAIRDILKASLPHYAIPTVFIELSNPPLHASGKVDRRLLPAPPQSSMKKLAGQSDIMLASSHPLGGPVPSFALRCTKESSDVDRRSALLLLFEEVLHLTPGSVCVDDSFFDLGGHSLSSVWLVKRIQGVFGLQVSLKDIYAYPTINRLLPIIGMMPLEIHGPSPPDRLYNPCGRDRALSLISTDFNAEARMEGLPLVNYQEFIPLKSASSVAVTGATGYLGAFILDVRLAASYAPADCKIIVLARGDNAAAATGRVTANLQAKNLLSSPISEALSSGRISVIPCDLTQPQLALSAEDVETVTQCQHIIHAGANVNLSLPYSALAPANVSGTKEIIRMASTAPASFLTFISTTGIWPIGRRQCRETENISSFVHHLGDGYGQSKWVCERLIEQARFNGLKANIVRCGNLAGASTTSAYNDMDYQFMLMRAAVQLGYAPDVAGWNMEMTAVDWAAGAAVALASSPSFSTVYHLANPSTVPADRIFDWIEGAGHSVARVTFKAWQHRLEEAAEGDETSVLARTSRLVSTFGDDPTAYLVQQSTFVASRAEEDLAALRYAPRPALDRLAFRRYANILFTSPIPRVSSSPSLPSTIPIGPLAGKVVVVTGGSSGIGRGICLGLASEGAIVAILGRNVAQLQETQRIIQTKVPQPPETLVIQCDVTDRDNFKDAIKAVTTRFHHPDILVNNAGVMYFTLMKNLMEDDWKRTVDVVCQGVLNGIGGVLDGMLKRGSGHIINISSDAGRKCFPGLSVYSAAKMFVEGVSQGLRLETANTGLKVTTIQPGNVATPLLAKSSDPEGIKMFGEPTGAKVLAPSDIADAVVYAATRPEHVAVNEVMVEPREEPC